MSAQIIPLFAHDPFLGRVPNRPQQQYFMVVRREAIVDGYDVGSPIACFDKRTQAVNFISQHDESPALFIEHVPALRYQTR